MCSLFSNVIFLPKHKRYQHLKIGGAARRPHPLGLRRRATQAWRPNTARREEGERSTLKAAAREKTSRNLRHWRRSLTQGGRTRTSPWLRCRLSLGRKLDFTAVIMRIIFEIRPVLDLPPWWFSTPLCGIRAQLLCEVKIQFPPTLPRD